MKASTLKTLTKIKNCVQKHIPEDCWGWFNGELAASNIPNLFNLSDEEVTGFATISCMPPHWAYRALVNRLGIPVPAADWAWHNCERPVELIELANPQFVTFGIEWDLRHPHSLAADAPCNTCLLSDCGSCGKDPKVWDLYD